MTEAGTQHSSSLYLDFLCGGLSLRRRVNVGLEQRPDVRAV